MTQKQKRKYSDILNRIDYYLKQADDRSSIEDLDNLIVAASPSFYFKDIPVRTISMFNVSGDIAHGYLSKIDPADTRFDSGADTLRNILAGASTYSTGGNWGAIPFGNLGWNPKDQADAQAEHTKVSDGLEDFTNKLFSDGTETDANTIEAAKTIANAINADSSYLNHSKDDLFPKEGILLHDDSTLTGALQAGAIRIQRVDSKDYSKGYNVYRNNASVGGGSYSKVAPWSDNERTKLNDQPIQHYKNAYKTGKDAMIAGGMYKDKKPQVRLGLGATLSRQQRRTLVQKVEKKLASREKAIKKGVGDRTRQRWNDNAQQFLIELPDNARNAAGEGIKKLGEKALEAADRLKEYENMFTEQVGAEIREGVEKAKPEIMKALQAVQRDAEDQFFNAQETWESAKQFVNEKAFIIQGILQQAKVQGSPIWNAATRKGAALTDKVMYSAGIGLVRAQAATDAASSFIGRMKSGFQAGYRAEMERQQGEQPSGKLYNSNPQEYWEKRGQLATQYAKANAEYDREKGVADRLSTPEETHEATKAAYEKFSKARDKVGVEAEDIGATLENVVGHVEKIKSGSTTVLPPAAGWPSAYGGGNRVRSLQRNIKIAGLKPYQRASASTGIPQAPTAPTAEVSAPAEGQQLAFDPAAMAGEGQPQAEAAQVPTQPTAEQPYLPGMTPGAAPGATQQVPMPGMGAEEGDQPVAGVPGGQIPTKPGGGGAAAGIPAREREYSTSAPYGLALHQGEERGEGKVSSFYDKREAKKAKAALAEKTGLVVPGVGASASQPGYGQAENEMAEPMDDYKQAAEEEEFKAKRSQSKSKIRTARANARMAKARADEAEAKASRSEAESGAKISHMLEKLDREIIELTAHANPKISSVLSRLEKAIDSKSKVSSLKK